MTKAPKDLESHFRWNGDALSHGQVIDTITPRTGHKINAASDPNVEQSFRMSKTDLRARRMFHHRRESIEAHLTVVFAALAIARHLQNHTGISIKKLVQTLRPLREVTITLAGQTITAKPQIPAEVQDIIDSVAH